MNNKILQANLQEISIPFDFLGIVEDVGRLLDFFPFSRISELKLIAKLNVTSFSHIP